MVHQKDDLKKVSYLSAGVDVRKADQLVDFLKSRLPHIGLFSGLFPFPCSKFKDPLLVASTDGVGTKLLIASKAGVFDSIGIDLVAMVCNDLITCGAEPLFFLDYIATGALDLDKTKQVLKGIIKGCEIAGCMLLGGETAEMPGFYATDTPELAGFGIGVVEKSDVIDGSGIAPGDLVIGIPSSGIHSNGYSLVRKILFEIHTFSLNERPAELNGLSIADALLEATEIYVPLLRMLKGRDVNIKGIAHITGGGIAGNLVRILPEGCSAIIDRGAWEVPAIFRWLQGLGNVSDDEMFRVFNMGVGIILVVSEKDSKEVLEMVRDKYPRTSIIGKIAKGDRSVKIATYT